MEKKTLIVNTPGFQIGGVENYFHSVMIDSINKGYRVIWVTTPNYMNKAFYRDLVESGKVEKVLCKDSTFRLVKFFPNIDIEPHEDVTMVSFTPEYYIFAEQLRNKYLNKGVNIKHLLILMNFFGEATYIEDVFKNKIIKACWHKYCKQLAYLLNENDCLLAFAMKQLYCYEGRYGIEINNKENKCLPCYNTPIAPSEDELQARDSKREITFIITACSRFEFPHKGFLIGLIKLFPEIKIQIPNAKLRIIGYGDTDKVNKAMIELPDSIRNDIELIGQTSPDELARIYRDSSLVVALAGAASKAASCGVVTLVARHNSYSCETYGYYGFSTVSTLNDEGGEEILPFIREVYEMPTEDYICLSRKVFDYYNSLNVVDKSFLFRHNHTNGVVLGSNQIVLGKIMILCAKTSRLIKRLFS